MEMEELLAKYFTEEASIDERTFVEKWRSQSEANARAFFEAKIIWAGSGKMDSHEESFFKDEEGGTDPKGLQRWLISSNWSKYVAAAILVLAIGLLFVLNQSAGDSTGFQQLTDGSSIYLHRNSSVEVLRMDNSAREVKISGKAFFDIERDENRPFRIHSENAEIVVLGTSFVVDADEAKTVVSVKSGTVEMKKDEEVSIKLEVGDVGIAFNRNEGLIKKSSMNENYLAWKTRLITFKGATMLEVATLLEDVYDVEIKFDNVAFENCKLTAQIQKKTLKEALEIIARTFEVEYTLQNEVATFKGRGC